MRMTKQQAMELAARHEIPLGEEYHTFSYAMVERVVKAADERKYRKPLFASGSRARYFYAYLNRAAGR